jgi:hypothetical protein
MVLNLSNIHGSRQRLVKVGANLYKYFEFLVINLNYFEEKYKS